MTKEIESPGYKTTLFCERTPAAIEPLITTESKIPIKAIRQRIIADSLPISGVHLCSNVGVTVMPRQALEEEFCSTCVGPTLQTCDRTNDVSSQATQTNIDAECAEQCSHCRLDELDDERDHECEDAERLGEDDGEDHVGNYFS